MTTPSISTEGPGLKVLLLLDGLWVGGTERSVAEMLPHLERAGVRALVACLRRCPEEGVERDVLASGADVRFLDARGILAQARALRRLLRRERPDVLHSALYQANLVARLAAVGLPPVVLNSLVNTPYEPIRFRDPSLRRLRLRLAQLIDAVTARLLADHFHAVSLAVKEAAVRRLRIPEDRITVVERGRDPRRLGSPSLERRRRARAHFGLAEDDQVVVSVGRQDYQKGFHHLLEAVTLLAPGHPRLRVLVAGREGAATTQLRALLRQRDLGDRVRFLGHREDVPELLAAADLFVLCSLFEGFPGAVVEALALGLPVVASDIPPLREVVVPGVTAVLVRSGDPGALAQALEDLLRQPERVRALALAAREAFERRLRIEPSVGRMLALYQTLARGPATEAAPPGEPERCHERH